jgi:aryl-alcohol dehydrogenase-like predicted oxidoreductase
MRTVKLGATRLEVTPIAYGTWQFGGDWGPVDDWAAVSAIEHARSLGINFFDTAQGYGFGRAERLPGRALAGELSSAQESVVIATKGGLRMDSGRLVRDASPAWLRRAWRPAWRPWTSITSTCTRCTGRTPAHRSVNRPRRWRTWWARA